MNRKTVALTADQYREIISTMRQGFTGCRPNDRIATALMLEANLGLRISDIVKLRLRDIVRDGERYRLSITEQKTGKARTFTVPLAVSTSFTACLLHAVNVRSTAIIKTNTPKRFIESLLSYATSYNILFCNAI